MELKDFVGKSIYDICMGIAEGADRVNKETGNYPVAPAYIEGKAVFDKMQELEFDIFIVISENSNKGADGGARIKVWASEISLKGNAGKQTKNESASRIKFTVPFSPGALRNNDS